MRKPHITTGTVHVNGRSATRTRRAQSPASKRKVEKLRVAEMRETAYRMQLEFVSQTDIAKALGVTQARVSQLLNEDWQQRRAQYEATAEQWRAMELDRINTLIRNGNWFERAATSPRTADTLLHWSERSDKLRGLYVSRHELGLNPSAIASPDDPKPDYTRLSDEEFATLDRLMQKACGIEPAPAPVYETVIMPEYHTPTPQAPALLEQEPPQADDSVVAVVDPPPETMRDKIIRMHQSGMAPNAICNALALSRSALLAVLEDNNTGGLQ
jgi:hypothetical protein